ncbi:MAG TPA: trans-aconitate 2-methyltransferase [Polyangia bacterium]|nr:trans-aconitate 2-methyltransferase [Polyangia bacterium]
MAGWDDAQYLKFGDQRTRAARELLARVPLEGAAHVVDLGCGPGNSTALLQARWPDARVTGVDNSEQMLARARQDAPGVDWVCADAASYVPAQPADLLFANAVFHWVPDHARLFPALMDRLARGGVLAVQMPESFDLPSHRLMREVRAAVAPGRAVDGAAAPVGDAAFYYDLLAPRARAVDVWRTTYAHVMPDADAIVEWVKGTGLRPYVDDLEGDARAAFLSAYRQGIEAAYPARIDGKRLFPFPRLFIIATR